MTDGIAGRSVADFLDAVASRTPEPGGGSVAAVTVGLAAGLTAMAARFGDRSLVESPTYAAAAEGLRARTLPLADADGRAYAEVLAAYALPRRPDRVRRRLIDAALSRAADVPLEVAEVGAAVAELAAELAARGNANLRGDAVTAALLAAAAAGSAAGLVRLNLAGRPDGRAGRAVALADRAAAAADTARRSLTEATAPGISPAM